MAFTTQSEGTVKPKVKGITIYEGPYVQIQQTALSMHPDDMANMVKFDLSGMDVGQEGYIDIKTTPIHPYSFTLMKVVTSAMREGGVNFDSNAVGVIAAQLMVENPDTEEKTLTYRIRYKFDGTTLKTRAEQIGFDLFVGVNEAQRAEALIGLPDFTLAESTVWYLCYHGNNGDLAGEAISIVDSK